jgi:hypothetical protein
MSGRQLFLITLRPARDVDPVIALRHLLKAARRLGLTCVAITTAPGSAVLEHAQPAPVLIDSTAERVAKRIPGHGREYGK